MHLDRRVIFTQLLTYILGRSYLRQCHIPIYNHKKRRVVRLFLLRLTFRTSLEENVNKRITHTQSAPNKNSRKCPLFFSAELFHLLGTEPFNRKYITLDWSGSHIVLHKGIFRYWFRFDVSTNFIRPENLDDLRFASGQLYS